MKLVEVIRTIATADDVYETVFEFGKKLGKTPVRTSDKTGFIVNRLLVPLFARRGARLRGRRGFDCRHRCGHEVRMRISDGPFTLLDFVGLDTTYYITNVMFDEFRERRFASPSLLKRMGDGRLVWKKERQGVL